MDQTHQSGQAFVDGARRCVDRHGLIAPGEGVLVAVSGGLDSVALLAALRRLGGEAQRGWRLTVAHLNHRLRADADADEQFVRRLAEGWGLRCVCARRDVKAEAARAGRGIEETARMLRYEFLQATAEACGAACVAVGHHADDNVETILDRLLRGTHLRGLAGIPLSRVLAGSRVRLVRPLLWARREEIEAFCRAEDLAWCTDSTNADISYRRNFIRHELLPLIRRNVNPRADEALLRLAEAAGQVETWAVEVGRGILGKAARPAPAGALVLDADVLAAQASVVRAYALRCGLENLGVPLRTIGADALAELAGLAEGDGPAAVPLPGGFVARRRGGEIIVEPAAPREAAPDEEVEWNVPGITELPGGGSVACEVRAFDAVEFEAHRRERPPGVELLDADQLRGRLIVRPRREGDAFVPLGAPGRQSVSDFLTNRKLPAAARRAVRCLCDDLGIVYLAPLRIDDRVKVTDRTRRVLDLRFRVAEDSSDEPRP